MVGQLKDFKKCPIKHLQNLWVREINCYKKYEFCKKKLISVNKDTNYVSNHTHKNKKNQVFTTKMRPSHKFQPTSTAENKALSQ